MTNRAHIDAHLQFLRETADHRVEVLHDDGLYKHLRFRKPGTGMWGWDIHTAPGLLMLNGDATETRVFSRETDMLGFFREQYPNFGYWAEKQKAGGDPRTFSSDAFLARVIEHLDNAVEWGTMTRDRRDELAREVRNEESYGGFLCAEDGHAWLRDHDQGDEFVDSWEWTFTEWDWSYLRSCYAIQAGIRMYDEHVNPSEVTEKAASLSMNGQYRWTLDRRWGVGPVLPFIMLNPSTADATDDDPTIGRCKEFARVRGFAGIRVLNLYSYRATDPKDLRAAGYPIGDDTDWLLQNALHRAYFDGIPVVAAWGANAQAERVDQLLAMRYADTVLYALGEPTKAGAPRHPLYLRGDSPLRPWAPPAAAAPEPEDDDSDEAILGSLFGRPVADVQTALV